MAWRTWAALLALAFVAGCGRTAPPPAAPPAPATASAAAAQATTFNGTDVAWLQLMIPMNEQALRLLALVPPRTADPATEGLAKLVERQYRAELERLRALRNRAGVPSTDVHEGHDMPGMVTADELRAAEQARDAALDDLLFARLREHAEQGVLLCHGVRTSGTDEATRALATEIERTRADQLARLAG